MFDTNEFYLKLLGVAEQLVAASDSHLRIAKNEADTTTEPDPEAQEHLKRDGVRIGRDLKLYAFIAEVDNPGIALLAFTREVAFASKLPHDALRVPMLSLMMLLPEDQRKAWREMWGPRQ